MWEMSAATTVESLLRPLRMTAPRFAISWMIPKARGIGPAPCRARNEPRDR